MPRRTHPVCRRPGLGKSRPINPEMRVRPVRTRSRTNIVEQRSSYQRGLVLGLTMAEIMILLVFCLLIAMATFLKREETRRIAAEQELEQQVAQNERTRDVVATLAKKRRPRREIPEPLGLERSARRSTSTGANWSTAAPS